MKIQMKTLNFIGLNSIQFRSKNQFISVVFYRSQRDIRSVNTIECLCESLEKLPGKRGQQHVVITGDANLHIDWETGQPQTNSFTKPLDVKMLQVCEDLNLVQKVNFPMRLGNMLDVLLTSESSKVINIQPGPPLADHDTVITDINLNIKKKPKSQHVIYKWKLADTDSLSKYVEEKLTENKFTHENNIEENWNIFKNNIT